MRPLLCLSAFLLTAAPAFASGGLSCTGDDEKAKFLIESGVTRGMGGPVFNFRGALEILDQTLAEDLRKTAFDGTHLAQYWLDERELRLLVYRERQGDLPHGYVELTIRTQVSEEGVYGGQYKLAVFDMTGDTSGEGKTVAIDGTVSCFVE